MAVFVIFIIFELCSCSLKKEKTLESKQKIIKDNENNLQYTEIDISDIKAKLKIFKSENKKHKNPCTYDIGKSRYNSQYLIDCYTILGGKNIKFYQPKNGELKASIFESENGKCIILPVRKPKEE